MYLRQLDLHGFKSFAQKTTITFAPGVTAIVGPNGCGKSNIVDSVRWVLGEQRARTLRSEKMDNVIFNGTAQKRPLGMAEVALTIENAHGVLPTHYNEVTVARRLYRSGESEYLLNGTTCRLKDVLDLFMDTGLGPGAYSVIELKMVEDVLSESAAERRRLFEEAAGVTKYKLRRRQALTRLDATHADLTRVADLAEELERRVASLQRQAQKAARHRTLAGRLERLELALAAHDHARLDAGARAADAEARAARGEAEGHAARLAAAEAALERDRAALLDRERALGEARQRLAAHTDAVRRLEAEAGVAAERRAADARALERLTREAEADRAREAELDAEAAALAARTAEIAATVAAAEAAEQAARTVRDAAAENAGAARRALAEARDEAEKAARAAADTRASRDRLLDRRVLRQEEMGRLADEIRALAARASDDAGAAAAEAAADRADAAFQKAEATFSAARDEAGRRRRAAEAAEAAARDARLARDTARAERHLLDALVDTAGDAAAFLADHAEWGHPLVAVADVVGADGADALALDAALGEWARCYVVPTEAAADEALARLRVADRGRATFLALDRLPARPAAERSPTPPGTTPALALARPAAPAYDGLLRLLLTNVFVADSLDQARRLRADYPAARFVTRDGEWTSALGAVHGGGAARPASADRLGLHERRTTADEALAAAEGALTRADADAAQARAAVEAVPLQEIEAAREASRRTRDEARADAARRTAGRAALDESRQRAQARLDALQAAGADEPDPAELDRAVEAEAERAGGARAAREAAQAAFDTAETARRDADARWNDARLTLARALADAEGTEREAERAARTRADLARREGARTAEADRLRASLDDAGRADLDRADRLDQSRRAADPLRRAVEAAEEGHLEARASVQQAEDGMRELRRARDAAVERQTGAEVRLAQSATRRDALEERLREEHGATLEDAAEKLDALQAEPAGFDVEAARAETPRLRESLRTLGAVNELALEEYDAEKTRLDEITAQRADLQEAEATLRTTIAEINRTAAERFNATFEEVRTHFQQLFRDLFGETAQADLALEGDDPLEAPVEIFAQPRGKRPVSLSQLSGGEKTLTAIALLFAIYLVKPSPFCILDEVDAPLDDTNVERFMQLIRRFESRTQFILVTHNKLTMEAADRLYGITMPEPGVSRLVGVRFDGAAGDGAAEPAPTAEPA